MKRRQFLGTLCAGTLGVGGGEIGWVSTPVADQEDADEHPYEPLGSVTVDGAREAVVHHGGDIAYVATGDGFAAVDITTPEDPTVVAERRSVGPDSGPDLNVIWDVWASEERLVVPGPAQPARDTAQGFALFDISNPEDPEQVAWYETDHYIHNSFFEDETVYLTGSSLPENPLVIVDVADDQPEEVGRWSLADTDGDWSGVTISNRVLHDVYVQDGIAYLPLWDAGTWIVDVTDPADPSVRSHVGDFTLEELLDLSVEEGLIENTIPPGNAHYAQVNQDASILLVGVEAWAIPDPETENERIGGPGGVDLWDVSEVESPTHLTHIEPPESFDNTQSGWFTTAHNCDIVDDRLYCSWYYGGVTVHDISDPSDPDRIARWRDPYETSFWTAQSIAPGEAFLASSANLGAVFETPNETRDALYVFPDIDGVQEDPPELTEGPTEDAISEETATPTPSPTETATPGGTPTDSPTPPASPTASPTPAESGSDADDGGPGFGAFGALSGLAGLAYLLGNRGRSEEPPE